MVEYSEESLKLLDRNELIDLVISLQDDVIAMRDEIDTFCNNDDDEEKY